MIKFDPETIKNLMSRSPASINFAGLSGNTVEMVKNGWELNVGLDRELARDAIWIRISGVHRAMALHFLSLPFCMDYEFAMRPRSEYLGFLMRIPWEIKVEAMAKNVIIQSSYQPRIMSRAWSGYLDIPNNFEKLTSIADFFQFPERGSELYIPENKIWTVEEHLMAIREAQEPLQDELLRGKMALPNNKQILKLVAI